MKKEYKRIILGTNAVGHDASIVYYDANTGDIFALDNERVTRIKHDGTSIRECCVEFKRRYGHGYGFQLDLNESYNNESVFTSSYLLRKRVIREVKNVYKLSYVEEINEFFNLSFRDKCKKLLAKFPSSSRLVYLLIYEKVKKNDKYYSMDLLGHYIKDDLKQLNFEKININFYNHHLSHCVSSYYFSPFDKCLTVSMDFSGDGYFSKVYLCDKGELTELIKSPVIPVADSYLSIGKIYSVITDYLGFVPNCDEGKVEALAAYGKKDNEIYYNITKNVFIKDNYEIGINKELDEFLTKDFLDKMLKKYGRENIAAAAQGFLEDFMVDYLGKVMKKYDVYDVCFSGGTFANVKLNMAVFEKSGIKRQYIFPGMSDSGCAAGSLILRLKEVGLISFDIFKKECYRMPYWGVEFTDSQVRAALDNYKDTSYRYLGDKWPEEVAVMVCEGKIGGIVHGRNEYGPRALGNRSVLADSRQADSRDRLNSAIKGRPSFQPFCPSVLEEDREELFEASYPNKHMTCAFRMKEKYVKLFPSAVHIDGTGRPQFVEECDNPNFYRFLKKIKEIIGVGIVVNTSFNRHGRTMVLSPEQAIRDFIDSKMDFICINGYLAEAAKT